MHVLHCFQITDQLAPKWRMFAALQLLLQYAALLRVSVLFLVHVTKLYPELLGMLVCLAQNMPCLAHMT